LVADQDGQSQPWNVVEQMLMKVCPVATSNYSQLYLTVLQCIMYVSCCDTGYWLLKISHVYPVCGAWSYGSQSTHVVCGQQSWVEGMLGTQQATIRGGTALVFWPNCHLKSQVKIFPLFCALLSKVRFVRLKVEFVFVGRLMLIDCLTPS
jgi:hypothetical protein